MVSYLSLRRLIGWFAIALPVMCFVLGALFGHSVLQSSVSYYYYTNVRDIFVGILVCVAMFLLTYTGYDRLDSVVTTTSGFFCLLVALFPCAGPDARVGLFRIPSDISNTIHLTAAVLFFLLLAFNSMFLFTKSGPGMMKTVQKLYRNSIFIACGMVMIICLIIVAVLMLSLDPAEVESRHVVFWAEVVLLLAFGLSWLVKGETLLRDRVPLDSGLSNKAV